MKGFGIALVGILAVAGGIAAATIITKKKLEKENDITDIEEEPDDAPVEDKKSAPAADARKVVEEETAPETSEKL